ncbi:hypothetical protein [Mesorhizobium xinjiangense]|uniref:hypothetical protein n=1 Tax=Mesorhizobium xinjiangense TaxID=2678685 RepID=UPI0012EECABB|nr:hypothetical protein [Mesorhizobium xinjiangense]
MRLVLTAAAISIFTALPLFVGLLLGRDMAGAGVFFAAGQVVAAAMCLPHLAKVLRRRRK